MHFGANLPASSSASFPQGPHDELAALARAPGRPQVSPTAYDTALCAGMGRTGAATEPAFPRALEWLLQTQHGDGTWGGAITHHHDRVVSTLAAMVALARWRETAPRPELVHERIAAAAWGASAYFARLRADLQATAGYALVVDRLVAEARWRGVAVPGAPASGPALTVARKTDPASAARPEDLDVAADGAAAPSLPYLAALENAWVMHALALVGPADPALVASLREPLDRLGAALRAVALRPGLEDIDIDIRAMAFRALTWAGQSPDPAPLLAWLDGPAAASANTRPVMALANVLGALAQAAPFPAQERAKRRALTLITDTCGADPHWVDDRHASPFLPTAQVIMALPADLTAARDAVQFLEETQLGDGSWGHFDRGTAEETAYCLQALGLHRRAGGQVNPQQLAAGARWLADRAGRSVEHPPLFVGQALYCPTRMVEASVLSALAIADQG